MTVPKFLFRVVSRTITVTSTTSYSELSLSLTETANWSQVMSHVEFRTQNDRPVERFLDNKDKNNIDCIKALYTVYLIAGK